MKAMIIGQRSFDSKQHPKLKVLYCNATEPLYRYRIHLVPIEAIIIQQLAW